MTPPDDVSSGQAAHAKYDRLIARAKQVRAAATVVVHPCDESSLQGAVEAAEAGIIVCLLYTSDAADE